LFEILQKLIINVVMQHMISYSLYPLLIASRPVAYRCIIPMLLQQRWNNAPVRHQLGRIAFGVT